MYKHGQPGIKSLGESYTSSVYTALYKRCTNAYHMVRYWHKKPREQAGNDVIIHSLALEKYYKSAASTDKVDGRIPDLTG